MMSELPWVAPLFTLLIAAASFYTGWISRVLKGERAVADVAALQVTVDAVKSDLGAFKIEVAQTYASHQTIVEMEERVTAAINRLGDRLDRILEPRRQG